MSSQPPESNIDIDKAGPPPTLCNDSTTPYHTLTCGHVVVALPPSILTSSPPPFTAQSPIQLPAILSPGALPDSLSACSSNCIPRFSAQKPQLPHAWFRNTSRAAFVCRVCVRAFIEMDEEGGIEGCAVDEIVCLVVSELVGMGWRDCSTVGESVRKGEYEGIWKIRGSREDGEGEKKSMMQGERGGVEGKKESICDEGMDGLVERLGDVRVGFVEVDEGFRGVIERFRGLMS